MNEHKQWATVISRVMNSVTSPDQLVAAAANNSRLDKKFHHKSRQKEKDQTHSNTKLNDST